MGSPGDPAGPARVFPYKGDIPCFFWLPAPRAPADPADPAGPADPEASRAPAGPLINRKGPAGLRSWRGLVGPREGLVPSLWPWS